MSGFRSMSLDSNNSPTLGIPIDNDEMYAVVTSTNVSRTRRRRPFHRDPREDKHAKLEIFTINLKRVGQSYYFTFLAHKKFIESFPRQRSRVQSYRGAILTPTC